MVLFWFVIAVSVVLGELDVIPNGWVEPHSMEEFQLEIVSIGLTIVGIPVAIRLFTLNTTKVLRRMNYDEALKSYHVWSVVRMSILCLASVFGIVVYYLAVSVNGVLCALVALCASVYCWPSQKKISTYLESVNNE